MICLPVFITCAEDVPQALQAAAAACDMVEFRIDRCADPGDWFFEAVRSAGLPVIVTDRAPEEGGESPRTPAQRAALLTAAADAGAAYIDCEHRFLDTLGPVAEGCKVIGSYHDFKTFPADIKAIMQRIEDSRADIVKVAVQAGSITDNFRLFKALHGIGKPAVALCMGEKGEISRILSRKFGSLWTYAVTATCGGTAPGQVGAALLRDMYGYHRIDASTAVYGVVGNPVKHSASPDIHNAAIQALGLDAVYVKFLVDDMTAFMQGFREIGFSGLSVTIPHKVSLLDCVDEADELAVNAGAANTAYYSGKVLRCTNTDIRAAVNRLAELAGGLQDKNVAVLGAGGAARGICYGLREEGARIMVVNRTLARAEELAGLVGAEWCGYDAFDGVGTDVLINTTSVGMHPDVGRSPVGPEVLSPDMIVFDAIYNPPDTELIRLARAAGCRTLTGVDMFLAQAEEQFRIWFGQEPPEGVMKQAFAQRFAGA